MKRILCRWNNTWKGKGAVCQKLTGGHVLILKSLESLTGARALVCVCVCKDYFFVLNSVLKIDNWGLRRIWRLALTLVCAQSLRHVQLFVTLWTVVPCPTRLLSPWNPTLGDLPNPGIEVPSFVSPGLAGELFTMSPGKHYIDIYILLMGLPY